VKVPPSSSDLGRGQRRERDLKYDPQGLHEFTVALREPGTQHRLTQNTFNAWLRRPAGPPAEMALKARLKELLGDAPQIVPS